MTKTTGSAQTNHSEIVSLVEGELSGFLDSKLVELELLDGAGADLLKEVRRLVEAGGSRIRPLLCVTAYQGCGGSTASAIMRVAASFELLHTFALIHDDLIDGGHLRRGAPTTLSERSMPTAVLAGDMAFALSDELYLGSGMEPADLIRAFKHLARARLQALTGQQLELMSTPSSDSELPVKIARLKTASYSLAGPLLVGAELAGASLQTRNGLEEFGEMLGVAYQLRDDLELLRGTGEKDVESDLRNGRPTALISAALRLATQDDIDLLTQIWGDPRATPAQIHTFIEIARRSGAEASVMRDVSSLVSRAKDALQRCQPGEVSETAMRVLNGIAERVSERVTQKGRKKGVSR